MLKPTMQSFETESADMQTPLVVPLTSRQESKKSGNVVGWMVGILTLLALVLFVAVSAGQQSQVHRLVAVRGSSDVTTPLQGAKFGVSVRANSGNKFGLQVVYAVYGSMRGHRVDVTSVVQGLFNQGKYAMHVSNIQGLIADPAPGIVKSFGAKVRYVNPRGQTKMLYFAGRDGSVINYLNFNQRSLILFDNTTPSQRKYNVLFAVYGVPTDAGTYDATYALQRVIDRKVSTGSTNFQAVLIDRTVPDFAPGQVKALVALIKTDRGDILRICADDATGVINLAGI